MSRRLFLGEPEPSGLGFFNFTVMKLPIKVNGKTYYMNSEDWELEQEWLEERIRNFPRASTKPFKKREK